MMSYESLTRASPDILSDFNPNVASDGDILSVMFAALNELSTRDASSQISAVPDPTVRLTDPGHSQVWWNNLDPTEKLITNYHHRDYILAPHASERIACGEPYTIRWNQIDKAIFEHGLATAEKPSLEFLHPDTPDPTDMIRIYKVSRPPILSLTVLTSATLNLEKEIIGDALYGDGSFVWTPPCKAPTVIGPDFDTIEYLALEHVPVTVPSGTTKPLDTLPVRHCDTRSIKEHSIMQVVGKHSDCQAYRNHNYPLIGASPPHQTDNVKKCTMGADWNSPPKDVLNGKLDCWFATSHGTVKLHNYAHLPPYQNQEGFISEITDEVINLIKDQDFWHGPDVQTPTSILGAAAFQQWIDGNDFRPLAPFFANNKPSSPPPAGTRFQNEPSLVNLDIGRNLGMAEEEITAALGDFKVEYAEQVGISTHQILTSAKDNVVLVGFAGTSGKAELSLDDWTTDFNVSNSDVRQYVDSFSWTWPTGLGPGVSAPVTVQFNAPLDAIADAMAGGDGKWFLKGFGTEWYVARRSVIAKVYELIQTADPLSSTRQRIVVHGMSQGAGIAGFAAADIYHTLNAVTGMDMDSAPIFLFQNGSPPIGGLNAVRLVHSAIPPQRRFRFLNAFNNSELVGMDLPYSPLEAIAGTKEIFGKIDMDGVRDCLYTKPADTQSYLAWDYNPNKSLAKNSAWWIEQDLIGSFRSTCINTNKFLDLSELDNSQAIIIGRPHWVTMELVKEPTFRHADDGSNSYWPRNDPGFLDTEALPDRQEPYYIRGDMSFDTADGGPAGGPLLRKRPHEMSPTIPIPGEYWTDLSCSSRPIQAKILGEDNVVRNIYGMPEYQVNSLWGFIQSFVRAVTCHDLWAYNHGAAMYFPNATIPDVLKIWQDDITGNNISKQERDAPLVRRRTTFPNEDYWLTPEEVAAPLEPVDPPVIPPGGKTPKEERNVVVIGTTVGPEPIA